MRSLALGCLAALACAAPASAAADRYVVPSGGATSGSCLAVAPCTIQYGIGSAGGGDTVHIAPGAYALSAPIDTGNVHIVGAGSDATLIRGGAGLAAPVVTIDNVTSIKNLTIESTNAQPALDLDGAGEGLEVYGSAGGALVLRGGSTLDTSVVHTPGAGATALRVSGGIVATTLVRHSTVVATGSSSKGIDASGLLASLVVRSSIVNGTGSDVLGDLLNAVTLHYSAWRSGNSMYTVDGTGNRDTAASFADVAGRNFQQTATSPTVNRGESSGFAQDLAGRQRQIGAAVDIGAYELPLPPTATTGSASSVTASSASVGATTNPQTVDTEYWVEYGPDPWFGYESSHVPAGSGGGDVSGDFALTGLLPGTTYYYRAAASNEWGFATGVTQTFDTAALAPVPAADAAGLVSDASARLEGTVHRGGAATTAFFEWGETTSYGNSTAVQNLGDGPDAVALSGVTLTGLKPNTEYHYRVVATNSEGTVQSADRSFRTDTRAPQVTIDPAADVSTTGATLAGEVDPGGDSTDWRFEYGVGGYDQSVAGGTVTGTSAQDVTSALTGLLPGTTYSYRLVAENGAGAGSATGTFTTPVAPPAATTAGAGPVAPRGATVAGRVNTGGGAGTWRVEYGRDATYGSQSGPHALGASASDRDVSVALSGLLPATTYHFRIVADNGAGTAVGGDATFTTPADAPRVTTGAASGIGQTGADVAGSVNPGGAATTWRIDYGKTAAYGSSTGSSALPAGNDSRSVAGRIDNLEAGVTYHYRVVAENSAGTTRGPGATFTTAAPAKPAPAPAPVAPVADPSPEPSSGGDTPTEPAREPAAFEAGKLSEPSGPVLAAEEPAPGETQADGLPAPTTAPPVGRSANAAPAAGTIRVRVPGSDRYVELTEGAAIPMGSVVDASKGQVTVTSAADQRGRTQTANFGGSAFKLRQKRAPRPITDIILAGNAPRCGARRLDKGVGKDPFAAKAKRRRKWSRRRLWGRGHGRFRTRGRRAAATVRGTYWLTEDRCDGTLVKVRRGLVAVRDLLRRKTVLVPAGDRYLARSRLSARERAAKRRRAAQRRRGG